MTDQLRQALDALDRDAFLSQVNRNRLKKAARAWSEFPTDVQVEAAARSLFGDFEVAPEVRAADLRQARAALEAAREVEKS